MCPIVIQSEVKLNKSATLAVQFNAGPPPARVLLKLPLAQRKGASPFLTRLRISHVHVPTAYASTLPSPLKNGEGPSCSLLLLLTITTSLSLPAAANAWPSDATGGSDGA